MMRLLRPFLAGYLALCLVGGGAVGLSPVLHRLVEHGGDGPAHTHLTFTPRPATVETRHDHGDGHPHSHAPERPRPARLFEHSHKSFGLPNISLARLWRSFSHFLEATTSPDSSPSKDGHSHEHQSLFQLLADGLIDQSVDAPLLQFDFARCSFVSPAPQEPLLVRFLDAQTAGRAPPLIWS